MRVATRHTEHIRRRVHHLRQCLDAVASVEVGGDGHAAAIGPAHTTHINAQSNMPKPAKPSPTIRQSTNQISCVAVLVMVKQLVDNGRVNCTTILDVPLPAAIAITQPSQPSTRHRCLSQGVGRREAALTGFAIQLILLRTAMQTPTQPATCTCVTPLNVP